MYRLDIVFNKTMTGYTGYKDAGSVDELKKTAEIYSSMSQSKITNKETGEVVWKSAGWKSADTISLNESPSQ